MPQRSPASAELCSVHGCFRTLGLRKGKGLYAVPEITALEKLPGAHVTFLLWVWGTPADTGADIKQCPPETLQILYCLAIGQHSSLIRLPLPASLPSFLQPRLETIKLLFVKKLLQLII